MASAAGRRGDQRKEAEVHAEFEELESSLYYMLQEDIVDSNLDADAIRSYKCDLKSTYNKYSKLGRRLNFLYRGRLFDKESINARVIKMDENVQNKRSILVEVLRGMGVNSENYSVWGQDSVSEKSDSTPKPIGTARDGEFSVEHQESFYQDASDHSAIKVEGEEPLDNNRPEDDGAFARHEH